jgi:hypothetical protein
VERDRGRLNSAGGFARQPRGSRLDPDFGGCLSQEWALLALKALLLLVQARHAPVNLSAGSWVIVSRGITVVGPVLVITMT